MDDPELNLPPDLRARALIGSDVDAIFGVVAACQLADEGEVVLDPSDLRADWARPDFDPRTMTIGIFDGSELVAVAEVFQGRAEVDVAPDHRGRSLGTELMRWTWQAALADGQDEVMQFVSDDRAGAAELLEAHGYQAVQQAWVLQIDLTEESPEPTLPTGVTIRDWIPGEDDRRIYDVVRTAFADFGHRSAGFENWVATTLHHEAVRPDTVSLAVEGGQIVGVALCVDYGPDDLEGWVEHLAVEREHRGRGIGGALLKVSFRRLRNAGKSRTGLATNSDTGALGLYEHVGMHVARSYTRYVKRLA